MVSGTTERETDAGAFEVLELSAPLDDIAFRKVDLSAIFRLASSTKGDRRRGHRHCSERGSDGDPIRG